MSEDNKQSMEELAGLMRDILKDNAKLRIEFSDSLRDMEERIIERVGAGFPLDEEGNPDFAGHRKYHELLMETQRERLKLYRAIIEKSLTALVWALFIFVGSALWNHVQELMKK